jgi:hypothetical protein
LAFVLAFIATIWAGGPGGLATAAAPRYSVEVRPELELLAGVLAQTSWMKVGHPEGTGSAYFGALKGFFSRYRDHEAIRLAEALTRDGFAYDAPPTFILHLGPLPDLNLVYDYDDYLVQRAGGRDRLEAFRLALKDLAARSGFSDFVVRWRDEYSEWVNGTTFDGEKVIDWLEAFFGAEASEYHVVLAPSLFPGGGYGPLLTGTGGERLVFQIVRAQGSSSGDPDLPTGPELEAQAIHEWGHSFVNPALAPDRSRLEALGFLFQPVRRAMRRMAYTDPVTFFNEQVLRAVTSLAAEDRGVPMIYIYERFKARAVIASHSDVETAIRYNESLGFYLTREVVAILREYQDNRNLYPDFQSFVPRLLDGLAGCEPKKLSHSTGDIVLLLLGVYVLGRVDLLLLRRMR